MDKQEINSKENSWKLKFDCKKAAALFSVIIALVISVANIASAAPLNIGQDQVQFEELGLTPDTELGGRSVRASGSVTEAPKYYFAPGLNVMSPTVITVLVEDPDRPAKVALHRHFWNEADLEAETDASGTWSFTGRIDDSVGIALSAVEATEVVIMIWAGEAVPIDVPPILFDGGRPVEPARDQ